MCFIVEEEENPSIEYKSFSSVYLSKIGSPGPIVFSRSTMSLVAWLSSVALDQFTGKEDECMPVIHSSRV